MSATALLSVNRLASVLETPRAELEALADHAPKHYESFDIRNRNGSWRHIDNPTGALKMIQTRIQQRILRQLEFPCTMLGGVAGRSISDNLEFHVGQAVIVTLDLRSCFPWTTHSQVFGAFRRQAYSDDVSRLLTMLTTYCRRVPQGAPTSLSVVNLALTPFHLELVRVAETLYLRVSMWVDDIVFSGARAREAIELAVEAARRFGHSVHPGKTTVMGSRKPHLVTGAVVNQRPSIGAKRRSEIRRRIFELSYDPTPSEADLRSVLGQVSFAGSICRAQGDSLRRLADRLLPLCGTHPGIRQYPETRPCKDASWHSRRKKPREAFLNPEPGYRS